MKKQLQKSQGKDSNTELESLRQEIREKFGEDSIRLHTEAKHVEFIPTGIISLDRALGGGIPLGRQTELVGNSGAGKTSIILSTMVQAQKKYPDKVVVYIDAEHALDIPWAVKLGIDLKRFDHVQPEFAEDALLMMERYAASKKVSLIGVDSIPALLPSTEMEGDIGDANIGLQARLIAQEMRRIGRILYKSQSCSVMLVNQKRAQLQSRGGFQGYEQTKATGGMALPFYMTTRMEIYRVGTIKNSKDEEIGQDVQVYIRKHKVLGGPGARATFKINRQIGIDIYDEILKLGIEQNKIIKTASWFKIADQKLQGEQAVKDLIKEDFKKSWVQEIIHEQI